MEAKITAALVALILCLAFLLLLSGCVDRAAQCREAQAIHDETRPPTVSWQTGAAILVCTN